MSAGIVLPGIRRLVHSVGVNKPLLVRSTTPSSLLTSLSWRRQGIASSSARLHDYADTYEGLLELYDAGRVGGDALEPGKTVSVTRFMNVT